MIRFWFSLAALLLMLIYTALLGALATHVPGFDLPPIWVYLISILSPVVLLAAHAMPFVLNTLPGEGSSTIPMPGIQPEQTKKYPD